MAVLNRISGSIANDELVIYDRWGEVVFESIDPSEAWDGTYHEKLLDPAVFVYKVSGSLVNGEPFEAHGNVTLVK